MTHTIALSIALFLTLGSEYVISAAPVGAHFFVAPEGSPDGDGSKERPWDLASALAHPGSVQPGDTIWLRGGLYEGPFLSLLKGARNAPILVRGHPGERAILDGASSPEDTLTIHGAWTTYWGFEVGNSHPERRLLESQPGREHWRRGNGITLTGNHVQLVNLVIHDAGTGISVREEAAGAGLYGNLVFFNGWQGAGGEQGRGIEVASGSAALAGNIVLAQVREGIYLSSRGIELHENVSFNSGALSPSAAPVLNIAAAHDPEREWAAEANYVGGRGRVPEGLAASAAGVVILPNRHESGRATVLVYNDARQDTAVIDLSLILSPGDEYELRDVQDYFGRPVAAGRFDGAPLQVRIGSALSGAPVGDLGTIPLHTAPEFAAFLLEKKVAHSVRDGREGALSIASERSAARSSNDTFELSAAAPAATGPVISSVTMDSISHSQARVFWKNSYASSSQIEYGTTTSYGKLTRLITAARTSHYWYLSGLSPNTKYYFRIRSSGSVSAGYSFTTTARGSGMPALPSASVSTAMPTQTGKTWNPATAAEFQSALDGAALGDTIVLQAGRVYSGNFIMRNKSGSGWIVIRTSNLAGIPGPGGRVSPSHAAAMPKIVTPNNNPALRVVDAAHHYRLIGLEMYPTGGGNENGVLMLNQWAETNWSAVPHHFIIDRCYLHGTGTGDHPMGIMLNSSDSAVIDSYIADFHHRIRSAAAIVSGNSPGRIKIENNYLESAGINVFFTDVARLPGLVISDLEIRKNHFKKQLRWRRGDPSYAGVHYSVKNILEFKNARRVLVDGNLLENNWTETQNGFAILLNTMSESCVSLGCRDNTIQDLTFSNNIVRHSGGGFNLKAWDSSGPTVGAKRIRIYNNVFEDIHTRWGTPGNPGPGKLFHFIDGSEDVIIDHNTGFQDLDLLVVAGEPHGGLVYRNNIAPYGTGVAGPGTRNAAALAANAPGSVFTKNVVAGAPSAGASLPAGNYAPSTLSLIGFVNLTGGDFRLGSSSPYNNAGTDGRDIGADVDQIRNIMSGSIVSPSPTPDPAPVPPPPDPAPGPTPTPTPDGANLLQNPGFESGGTAWQFATTSGRSVVTTQPYAGTRALQHIERLVNDVGTYQDIAATAGAAYSVSGWVKTSNITSAGAGFVVVWMDSAGLALRRDYSSKVNGTKPWTPLSLSLTAPAGARKLRLRFYTTNHWSGSGTIWFDEARVVAAGSSGSTSAPMPSTSQTPPAPVGSNLLADSGFESNGTGWQWATGAGRSVVSTQPHSGAKVLQHVEKSVNQLGSFQNLAAIPGKTYDVSGWIRTQGVGGTGAGVQVVWLNSSNGTLRIDNSRKVTGTQPWTQVSLTLTAPSGASILRFRFFTAYRPTGTGTIWYDDAQVIPR